MDIQTLGIPDIRVNKRGAVEAVLRLPAWEGYLTKRWENARVIADGTTIVTFGCHTDSPAEFWAPQVKAYNSLIEHQFEIRDAIVASVAANIRELIGYLDENDPDIPPISASADTDLRRYIGLRSIIIRDETKDDTDYVEWSLNCAWDEEHGLAAVTHRNRLIDLDSGEIDIYKIFADNDTLEEELKLAEYYRNNPSKPIPPKPWWKLW